MTAGMIRDSKRIEYAGFKGDSNIEIVGQVFRKHGNSPEGFFLIAAFLATGLDDEARVRQHNEEVIGNLVSQLRNRIYDIEHGLERSE